MGEIPAGELDRLPADMVPYPRAGLDNYLSCTPYAELGW